MSVSSQVILASGYYAAFKVTLVAKALEGIYDGAVHITTDYEVCVSSRKHSFTCFPQKWCWLFCQSWCSRRGICEPGNSKSVIPLINLYMCACRYMWVYKNYVKKTTNRMFSFINQWRCCHTDPFTCLWKWHIFNTTMETNEQCFPGLQFICVYFRYWPSL